MLMTAWRAAGLNDAEIAVLDLETGKHRSSSRAPKAALSPGFIVFFRAGAYHAVRFDPQTQERTGGEPVRALEEPGNPPQGDSTEAALGAAGTLAYTAVRRLCGAN